MAAICSGLSGPWAGAPAIPATCSTVWKPGIGIAGQDPPQRAPDVAAPVLGQDRAKRRLRDFGDSPQLTLVGLHPASCCHRQGLLQTHKKKGSELVDLHLGRVAIDEVHTRRADAERRGGVAQLG
jgi:hypothetical protein